MHCYPRLEMLMNDCKLSQSEAVDLADSIALYEPILRLKPGYILELEHGTSTNIIALHVRHGKY